jgi:hypothetical protein
VTWYLRGYIILLYVYVYYMHIILVIVICYLKNDEEKDVVFHWLL